MPTPSSCPMPCCAGLPVGQLSISVFVCHTHGSIRAHARILEEDGGDPETLWDFGFIAGPFDSWADSGADLERIFRSAWSALPVPGLLQR